MDAGQEGVRHRVVQVRPLDWTRVALFAVPALAWAGVLFWLSAQSGETIKDAEAQRFDIPGLGYFAHGALYFVLGGLAWLWARAGLGVSPGRGLIVAVVFAVLYGVSDEWHQSFVPGRSPDALDVVADGFGALAAAVALWGAGRTRASRVKSPSGDEDAG